MEIGLFCGVVWCDFTSEVSCCYLEIYNEDIRDLLQPGGPVLKPAVLSSCRAKEARKSTHFAGQRGPIAIREDAAGGIKVSGIHAETCTSAEEMLSCLSDGSVQRTTGATLMNEHSSRPSQNMPQTCRLSADFVSLRGTCGL